MSAQTTFPNSAQIRIAFVGMVKNRIKDWPGASPILAIPLPNVLYYVIAFTTAIIYPPTKAFWRHLVGAVIAIGIWCQVCLGRQEFPCRSIPAGKTIIWVSIDGDVDPG